MAIKNYIKLWSYIYHEDEVEKDGHQHKSEVKKSDFKTLYFMRGLGLAIAIHLPFKCYYNVELDL